MICMDIYRYLLKLRGVVWIHTHNGSMVMAHHGSEFTPGTKACF